ncbi:MAG: hypothetical protein CUN55_14995 [Phototrophicales bacterium]|nr:MAG: hypothetical protein CUN55_14995 [Phototrophicales bacterium]
METITISQVALLVFWFALALMIFIVALIARFYEANTQQKTYYRWYVFPVVLFGLSSIRYVSLDKWGHDLIADSLTFLSGLYLLGLSLRLYHCMTNRRKLK